MATTQPQPPPIVHTAAEIEVNEAVIAYCGHKIDKWSMYGILFAAMDRRRITLRRIKEITAAHGIAPGVVDGRRADWLAMRGTDTPPTKITGKQLPPVGFGPPPRRRWDRSNRAVGRFTKQVACDTSVLGVVWCGVCDFNNGILVLEYHPPGEPVILAWEAVVCRLCGGEIVHPKAEVSA